MSGSTLLGYLKLSINIGPSLALAGAAVNAQIVKICNMAENAPQAEAPRFRRRGFRW